MHNWLNQHQQAAMLVIDRLRQQWLSTVLIITVIGVTLAIPGLIYVILQNANSLMQDVKQDTQMSIFLQKNATPAQVDAIKAQLDKRSEIAKFTFIPKETALKQLMETTDQPELIASLNQNPLPDAFFITPHSLQQEAMTVLKTSLQDIEGVAEVVLDSAWVNRLNSILSIGSKAVWIFGGLLGFALIAVISNTIRMQTLTHKEEIEVSELFGATQSFIRRPFLYLGTFYGLGGGVIACMLLWLILYLFNQSVVQIAREYASDFTLRFSHAPTYLGMVAISVLIGWLAAYLAITLRTKNA